MRVIGLDVGGANLKASDGERRSLTQAFPLWERPDQLGSALQQLLSNFTRPQHLAVTMTGELADCFATKAEGVRRILESVTDAVDVPLHVWQHSGEFVSPEDATTFPMLTAAANWHALATWAGRMTPRGTALLVDVGSTTTDFVPIVDGLPTTGGTRDVERLAAGELIYSGIRRTPVCAVTPAVNLGGREIPLAAEFFATMHDIALILGTVGEAPSNLDTADGRPATIEHARSRLARMLCCDRSELTDDDLNEIARAVSDAQQQRMLTSLNRLLSALPEPPSSLLLSGEGEPLARRLVEGAATLADTEVISLRDSIGPEHSMAACAFALARLGTERVR
jgi:probable H4MPT-linked C1 transfer pathway protein